MSDIDKVLSELQAWRDGRLWGAKRIAGIAGVSVDTIPRWADLPDCPIKRIGGRYFVLRTSLVDWLTTKDAA
jgi:hypothetical protein